MASSEEWGSGLPSYRRHGTVAPPAPIVSTPWPEDTPSTQAMTMIPPWALAPWLDTGLPFQRWCAF
jgi:hypothetical protein